MQWNCRAINTARDLLVQHLAGSSYQVLALQSLHTSPHQLPTLPGYHYPPFFATDDPGKVRTATYVSIGLAARAGSLPGSPLEEGYGVVSSVSLQDGRSVHLLNFYNPTTSLKFEWLGTLPDNWIVVGDFNRRDALWEDGYPRSSPELCSQLDAADIVLLNDGRHTRLPDCPEHGTSALDLSFASPNIAGITEWAVQDDPLSSDHLPITVTLHLTPTTHPPPSQATLNLGKADWTTFQAHLADAHLKLELTRPIEELNTLFTDIVLEAARLAIPVTGGKHGRRGHPWWTENCKEAVEKKKLAYQRYRREGSESAHIEMKQTKALCKKTIAQAKLDYWKNVKKDKLDLTEAWKRFKAPDGRVLRTAEDKAEGLLHHFASASSSASLPAEKRNFRAAHDDLVDLPPPPQGGAHGPLALRAEAGKQRNLVENHRPVALTSHVGKVYERIILNRLSHHVDSNKCLPKLQAGFRRGRSVTDHVVKLAEHIRRARRQRRILHTCFLDISKAFDTVWHTKLLLKLKSIGVSPAIFNFSRYRRPKKNSANHRAKVRVLQEQVDVVVNHLMDLGFTLSGTKTVYMPVHSKGYNAGQYPDWNQITVCGTAVKPAASVRYLGVTFQRDGLWNEHLRLACLSARRALNLVRVIRREKWGQRRETLIPIIQSLVRSRLFFGAPALHDLPPTAVQRMARVECQALRLGLGLAKSVPQAQIYNEAGLLPLWHCLKKDALRDICKKAKIQPGQRRRIAQCQVDPFPPWTLTPPEVELNLPGVSRRDDPHTLAARAREQIALKYRDDLLIYTDGSVFEDGRSGAGIYLYNTKEAHPVKLPPTTILTAELVAIREAVQTVLALPHPPPQVTVLSDSKSSLIAIQNGSCASRPAILNDVLCLLTEAGRAGVHFRFQWVPSHVGLLGNEMADKTGATLPNSKVTSIQPSAHDLFCKIDRAAWDLWKLEYHSTAVERGWLLKTCLGPTPPTFSTLPPYIAATVSRIRVNHWRTKYTTSRCTCGAEVSFKYCLFLCPELEAHFRPLRTIPEFLRGISHNLRGGQPNV
ncbi:uncharacterized protein LOC143040552 [Oratosquilla oratoria]|uniref:uncharacterized protein LOC143040552 n=1 Tax=Oratosquilla oratoria TaxID=337810 RepID=UPI003F76B1E1